MGASEIIQGRATSTDQIVQPRIELQPLGAVYEETTIEIMQEPTDRMGKSHDVDQCPFHEN